MISKKTIFELATAIGGIPVLGALAGSPAAQAGIRYGDILLSVNGHRIRTVVDYVEAKALRTDGMDVLIFRDGVEQTLALTYRTPKGAPDTASILAEVIAMRIVGSDDMTSSESGGEGGTD